MDSKEAEELIRPMLETYEIDDIELQKMALGMSCGIDGKKPKPLHTEAVDRLAQRASQDVLAFDVAIVLAVDGLRRGWPLPPHLREFIACVLDDSVKRPVKRGPKLENSRLRNQRICAAIEALRDHDVTLEEACSHVADAACMSSETISGLWKKRDSDRDATLA
jgi:hypothetical protein